MCGPHPYLYASSRPLIVTGKERQQLQAAIDRLERVDKEWCHDALLVLDAAKKHLQTLPKPANRFRVTVCRKDDYKAITYDFDTRSDAVKWITVNLWAYTSFSIDEVEGC